MQMPKDTQAALRDYWHDKFETSQKMGTIKTGTNRQKVVSKDAVGCARHLKSLLLYLLYFNIWLFFSFEGSAGMVDLSYGLLRGKHCTAMGVVI